MPLTAKHDQTKDTAAGEGTVRLKQLHGDVNPLAFHRLAVVC